MKKLFYNEDGTFKVMNIIILVDVIVAIILLFMVKSIYGTVTEVVDIKRKPSTTKTTTTIDLCNGCKIEFNRKEFNASPRQVYLLEDLLNLKKITLQYVEFKISDETLAKMTKKDNKVAIEILDSVGKFTLTASYYSEKTSIDINISSDKLIDIELDQDIYYVKNGGSSILKYETIPKGYKASEVEKVIADTNIAELDSDGNIIGKNLGKTTLTISSEGITKSIPIYVVNSNTTIKVKESYSYKDFKTLNYTLGKKNEYELLLSLENTNLNNNDVTYEVITNTDVDISLEYVQKNSRFENSYEYLLIVNPKGEVNDDITIIFTLSDGSKKELILKSINE